MQLSYTWVHLVLKLPWLALDATQVLRDSQGEALVSKPHVLLSDRQGTVQAFARQLKIIHGHLQQANAKDKDFVGPKKMLFSYPPLKH